MAIPTNGHLVTDSAIGGFVGADGEPIEFEKQKDGSYTAKEVFVPLGFDEKGKESGKVKYTYSLTPNGRGFLEVSVAKQRVYTKEQKEEALATGEIVPGTLEAPVPEKDLKKSSSSSGKKGSKHK